MTEMDVLIKRFVISISFLIPELLICFMNSLFLFKGKPRTYLGSV